MVAGGGGGGAGARGGNGGGGDGGKGDASSPARGGIAGRGGLLVLVELHQPQRAAQPRREEV